MYIKQFLTGGDSNFGYLVADESSKSAMIIDPSFSPLEMVTEARDLGFTIQYIFNTHCHEDHTNGNLLIEQYTDIKPLCFGDTDPTTHHKITHNSEFPLGNYTIRILHTPGHTPESISIFMGDAVFTGDTLFVGQVGPTYTEESAQKEYDSIHSILLKLPPKTKVFPGHDYGETPESTIEHEQQSNPFLTQPNFESFQEFKREWASTKKNN